MANKRVQFNEIRQYLRYYGGLGEVFKSWYFWFSVLFTLASTPYWYSETWWEVSLSITPNILGFTLGGYAIFIGLGDERFRIALAGSRNGKPSPLMRVAATFMHFIMLQSLATILSIAAIAIHNFSTVQILSGVLSLPPVAICTSAAIQVLFDFLSFLLFVYAVVLAIPASLALFMLTLSFDRSKSSSSSDEAANEQIEDTKAVED